MRFFTDTDRYIPIFDGAIKHCRAIDDHLIIFDRGGNILYARTCEAKLRSLKNFFELTGKDDTERIVSLCTSFEIRHIVTDTELGGAIVFTELFGISGLLFAVIPLTDRKWVFEYYKQENLRHISHSDSLTALSATRRDEKEIERVKKVMETADGMISCAETAAARYSFGASIGQYLAERILIAADCVGCVGRSRAELDALPNLTNFSAELFNVFTLLAVAFAREHGAHRDFSATVGEAQGHLWVSFRIDVSEDFTLYRNGELHHGILEFCDGLAASRDIIFDLSHNRDTNRLTLSFTPESDRFINRVIKQSIRDMIKDFWENAL